MPFSQKTYEEKPYNRCITCEFIGKHCDGPNFLAMDMTRLSEWCRLRKDYLHTIDPKWTNIYIADQAQVSKTSIDRFLSGHVDDIRVSTIARIVKVLVNGSWGQYPCANEGILEAEADLMKQLEEVKAENNRLREAQAENRQKIDFLKEQVKFKEDQMQKKDRQLDERRDYMRRKDKTIIFFAVMFFICLAVIITALIVDRLNRNIGFFWTAAFDITKHTGWFSSVLAKVINLL